MKNSANEFSMQKLADNRKTKTADNCICKMSKSGRFELESQVFVC